MLLLYIICEKVNVSTDHIERSMSEYLLQLEYPCSILNAHLRKGMSESMRATSYIFYACLLIVVMYSRLHLALS